MSVEGPIIKFKPVNAAKVERVVETKLGYVPETIKLTGTVSVKHMEAVRDMMARYQQTAMETAFRGAPSSEPHFVYCRYRLPSGRSQLTQVFCPKGDEQALADILAKRGMGEVFDSPARGYYPRPKMASEHMLDGEVHKAMHAAIWIGMILNHCDPEAGREAMMDDGAIHEMSHKVEVFYDRGSHGRRDLHLIESDLRLVERLIAMERKVPGLRPTWGLSASAARTFDKAQTDRIALIRHENFERESRLWQNAVFEGMILRGNHESMTRAFDGLKTVAESVVVTMDEMRSALGGMRDFPAQPVKPLPNQRAFEMSRLDDAKTGKQKRIEAFMAARDKKTASTPPKAGEIVVPMQEASTAALMAALGDKPANISVDLADEGGDMTSILRLFAGDKPASKTLTEEITSALAGKSDLASMLASFESTERLHRRFHTGGFVSGRMSKSGPEMQRIPKAGKPLSYVSEDDIAAMERLGSADYSAVERRLALHLADKVLAETYEFTG